jgi:hypothetical protein
LRRAGGDEVAEQSASALGGRQGNGLSVPNDLQVAEQPDP